MLLSRLEFLWRADRQPRCGCISECVNTFDPPTSKSWVSVIDSSDERVAEDVSDSPSAESAEDDEETLSQELKLLE